MEKEDLFNGAMMADATTHVISVILISGAVVLVGAIVMHPTGERITAPAQLAELLVPVLGGAAKYVMGIALLGAGFSSLLGNTQRGMVLLGAGFQKPVALESRFIRVGCLLCLALACVICFSYGGSPTQLIYIANVLTAISTPVGGLFICLLLGRKDVSGDVPVSRPLQVCMIISYIFCVVMTISALATNLPKMLSSFGL